MATVAGAPEAQARGYNARAAQAAARQRMISTAQAELSQARQVLSAAQQQISQASGAIDNANSKVKDAKSAIDSAKSEERSSHESLESIEADLLVKAGGDSEIGRANTELQAAKEEFDLAKRHAINSEDYKAQLAEITDPTDRPKKLPLIQKEALKNDERYQTALSRLKAAKLKFGNLRTDMVRSSPEWMAASQAVKEAQHDGNKANADATKSAMAKMPANANLREARAVAEQAAMTIANCEQILKQLGVKPNPPPKTSTASTK